MNSFGKWVGVALLSVCAAQGALAQLEEEPLVSEPVMADRGELIYHVLIGEMAFDKGDGTLAVDSFLSAALRSDDPALAERATQVAIRFEDWEAAELTAQHWAYLTPDSLNVQRLLAGVYLRLGDPVNAAGAFEQVLSLAGESFDSGATSILAALQQEPDRGVSIAVAEELVARHPDNAMGYFVVGQLASDASEFDQAIDAFDKSLAIQPAFGRAQLSRARVQLLRGETDDALDTLENHVRARPADVVAHQGFVQLLIEAERVEQALAEMETLYQSQDSRSRLVFNLGLMALELQALPRARVYLERAVELDPLQHDGHYYLGRIHDFEQDVAQAVIHYDLVERGVHSFESALRAAELVGRSTGLAEARVRLDALRDATDPDGMAQIALSESGLLQFHDDYDGALDVLDTSLEHYAGHLDLHYARGLLLSRLGDERGFEREMQVVLDVDPDSAQALNALGYALADRNENLDEAERLITRANELEPDDAAILDSMGWVNFRLGNLPEAQLWLERAYAQLADAEIAAHLVEVLWVSDQLDAARSFFAEARESHPDSPLLAELNARIPALTAAEVEGDSE